LVERLSRLIALQKLDDELAAVEEEHAGIPARRAAGAAEHSAADERLAAAREAFRNAELAQRHAERELQDRETAVAKLEGQQFQVKTNEAYTALLREIDHGRAAISACETRILEAMEAVATSGAALAEAERSAKSAGERSGASAQALEARERELAARIATLRERRAEARALVDAELAALYDRVAARRRPAVVMITTTMCTGCRVDIPPQRYIELKRRNAVVTCQRCQRILVHVEGARVEPPDSGKPL
jgi:predicted  nucleic acid-binding Zn-ribbon protein